MVKEWVKVPLSLGVLAAVCGISACSDSTSEDTQSSISIREVEPNDTGAFAQPIQIPMQVLGITSSNGDGINPPSILDPDVYSFTLAADADVMFYLSEFGTTDLDLELTTAADPGFGSPIAGSYYPAGYNDGVKAALSAGNYLVRVYPYATNMTTTGYSLSGFYVGSGGSQSGTVGGGGGGGGGGSSSCTSFTVFEIENNDFASLADFIPYPGTIEGRVTAGSDQEDWSYFTPSASGGVIMRLSIADTAANLDLALYDTDRTTLLRESTLGTGSNEQIFYTLTAGNTYYLRVSGVLTPNGATDYSLCVE